MADKFHPFGQKIAIKAPPPAKIQVSAAHSKPKPAPAPAPEPTPAPTPTPEPEPVVVPKFTCPACGVKLDTCPVCNH